jgi:hypothetical protein
MDPLLDRVVAAVGDHYLIEGEVGRGGMAVVYRALDLRLHRHVAIRSSRPSWRSSATSAPASCERRRPPRS